MQFPTTCAILFACEQLTFLHIQSDTFYQADTQRVIPGCEQTRIPSLSFAHVNLGRTPRTFGATQDLIFEECCLNGDTHDNSTLIDELFLLNPSLTSVRVKHRQSGFTSRTRTSCSAQIKRQS